ncbi:phospholipase [Aureococcus anophagefferens]|nr:phospholipase [Aureococcus anophagefferens]
MGRGLLVVLLAAAVSASNDRELLGAPPRTAVFDDARLPAAGALERLIYLAESSYCVGNASAPLLPSKLAAGSDRILAVVEARGARVVVGAAGDGGSLWVSFRGTENYENWIDNVKFVRVHPYDDDPDVGVEDGFLRWYEGLKGGVAAALAAAAPGAAARAPVHLVGHSAGGAVATLAAYDFLRGGVFPDALALASHATFGSPRVGNAEFVADFSARLGDVPSFRVTHADDVIPHLPQTELGFLHVPGELWQANDTAALVNCDDDDTKEDPTCSNSCAPLRCTSKADHLRYLGEPLGIAGCV